MKRSKTVKSQRERNSGWCELNFRFRKRFLCVLRQSLGHDSTTNEPLTPRISIPSDSNHEPARRGQPLCKTRNLPLLLCGFAILSVINEITSRGLQSSAIRTRNVAERSWKLWCCSEERGLKDYQAKPLLTFASTHASPLSHRRPLAQSVSNLLLSAKDRTSSPLPSLTVIRSLFPNQLGLDQSHQDDGST